MDIQTHHIIKQQISLHVQPGKDATSIQKNWRQQYSSSLVPAMARLFDEKSSPDVLIRIPYLEIELGRCTENLTEDVVARILEQLEEAIRSEHVMSERVDENPVVENIEILSQPESVLHYWLHFLVHGTVPWPAAGQLLGFTRDDLVEILAPPGDVRFRQILQTKHYARERLVKQYDSHFLLSLFEVLTKTRQDRLRKLLEQVQHLIERGISSDTEEDLFEKSFTESEMEFTATEEQFVRLFLQKEFRDKFWRHILRDVVKGSGVDSPDKLIADFVEQQLLTFPSELVDSELEVGEEEILVRNESEGAETWYLDNAGLILLHPFLSGYLTNCELQHDGKFPDPAARDQALHLFHYLATGRTNPEEFELLLPKVLCGAPLKYPARRYEESPEEMLAEADHLLKVVISEWGALGDVSIDSLREGFLCRPGKLTFEAQKWKLIMEQQPIDVLLDRLPWGLGIVKTPWMKHIMHVEWNIKTM